MRRLSDIEREYEEIMHSILRDQERDRKLSALMSIMEREFKIPILQNLEWEAKNRAVIAMYRKLSMSRKV